LFLRYSIDPIRLCHGTIISSLEVSQLGGRAYQNMDALGGSWLHYGVHAISDNIVGSGVHIVFPEYEFEPHLHGSCSLFALPSGLLKHNESPFKPFSDPLNMKRFPSDLVILHAR
jgi:hypothetical protein